MIWWLFASAFAGNTWTTSMLRMEKSATNMKNSAVKVQQIAVDQIKNSHLNRMTELTAANALLSQHVAEASLAFEKLERASQ